MDRQACFLNHPYHHHHTHTPLLPPSPPLPSPLPSPPPPTTTTSVATLAQVVPVRRWCCLRVFLSTESVRWHSRSSRDVCAAMSRKLAFLMFGVSVELSCALVPFLHVGSCKGCGSVAAGLLDPMQIRWLPSMVAKRRRRRWKDVPFGPLAGLRLISCVTCPRRLCRIMGGR